MAIVKSIHLDHDLFRKAIGSCIHGTAVTMQFDGSSNWAISGNGIVPREDLTPSPSWNTTEFNIDVQIETKIIYTKLASP